MNSVQSSERHTRRRQKNWQRRTPGRIRLPSRRELFISSSGPSIILLLPHRSDAISFTLITWLAVASLRFAFASQLGPFVYSPASTGRFVCSRYIGIRSLSNCKSVISLQVALPHCNFKCIIRSSALRVSTHAFLPHWSGHFVHSQHLLVSLNLLHRT